MVLVIGVFYDDIFCFNGRGEPMPKWPYTWYILYLKGSCL